ncbi:hypothetical protein ACWCXH_27745 [Kitasatospora sp. NPDC001660]
MRIELRIARLVLDGVAPGDAVELREALECELTALLTADPPVPGRNRRVCRAATAAVAVEADPAVFGRGIAGAVHHSLRHAPGGGR